MILLDLAGSKPAKDICTMHIYNNCSLLLLLNRGCTRSSFQVTTTSLHKQVLSHCV